MTHDDQMLAACRRDYDRLEQLRKEHPDGNIWNVPSVTGPTTWHAQPSRYPLHADSADHLEEYIGEDEAPSAGRLHRSSGC